MSATTNRKHKLITKALESKIPALYSTEQVKIPDKVITSKLFSLTGWRWYIIEAARQDDGDLLMFTFVTSPLCPEGELGYTSLDELEALAAMNGQLPLVERDLYWDSDTLLSAVMNGSTF